MNHSVRRHLRLEIEAYDKTIRAFIPAYEEMLARAADAIAEAQPKKVIDLGAGTGALAQAILQRCEGATVELIDADAEMLDQARERLAPFASRVQYIKRAFQGPLPACDAAVASLALHHVPTLAEKRTIFSAIHAALPPGGVFVNADATMPADPPLAKPNTRLGQPTSSPAASPRSAPTAISRNGPTKTPTFPWKTNSPR